MALAVTILVLLILAGISITAALGDKGIINETKNVQKDIAYLQNQTLDDLHQLTNELSTSVWDALEPEDPDTPTTPEVKVTKITITAPSSPVTVKQGGTLQLSVAVEPSNASNKDVIWSSNVASIAAVDQTGRVTGVSIGTATIIATAKDGSGTTATKAGISFEFLDCLMDSTPMHTSNSNTNGWVIKSLYKTLNNTTNGTYIGLQNSGIPIKQVQKTYNAPATEGADTPQTSSDYLWLLSCTEIWGNSAYTDCVSGHSKAKEGEQYAFYSNCTPKPVYNTENDNIKHYKSTGTSASSFWLRSPYNLNSTTFCYVTTYCTCLGRLAGYNDGVAPGFCI